MFTALSAVEGDGAEGGAGGASADDDNIAGAVRNDCNGARHDSIRGVDGSKQLVAIEIAQHTAAMILCFI